MDKLNGHYWHNRDSGNTSCSGYRSWVCANVSNKFITKDVTADIKNLYNIVVKLIDSNREAKDEVKKTMTGINVIKDIMIKLFRNGKK